MTTTRPAFAPWDDRNLSRIVSPEESARRVRTFAAVEERAGQLLDAFAGTIGIPHAKATLERHARNHAFHAEVLRERVADAAGSKGDTVEDADVAAFLDAVGEPKDGAQAIEFLSGVYRVLVPRTITAYTYFLTALGADAADADERWYGLVLNDLHDSIRDGELLLQTLLQEGGEAAVQRAADRRAQLETLILKAGGIVGADSLGGAPTSKETTR